MEESKRGRLTNLRYLDVGNIQPHFHGLYWKEAIEQGLDNLFSVRKGERIFRPDFGSDLDNILFDPVHEITTFAVRNKVMEILAQEERIEVRSVNVELKPDEHTILLEVEYIVRGDVRQEVSIWRRKLSF